MLFQTPITNPITLATPRIDALLDHFRQNPITSPEWQSGDTGSEYSMIPLRETGSNNKASQ